MLSELSAGFLRNGVQAVYLDCYKGTDLMTTEILAVQGSDEMSLTNLTYELVMRENIFLIGHKNHPLLRNTNSTYEHPQNFRDLRRRIKERFTSKKRKERKAAERAQADSLARVQRAPAVEQPDSLPADGGGVPIDENE